MTSQSNGKTTTQQEFLRFYPLTDGRMMALQHARACYPVEVVEKNGQLYAGTLEVVLKRLSFLRANILLKGILNLTNLVIYIDEQGVYFPGVYLYDCLLRPEGSSLIPLFSSDTTIVFLGSRATCVSNTLPEAKTPPSLENQNILTQKLGLRGRIKNWLSGKEPEVEPIPRQVAVPVVQSEVGYLALKRNDQGDVYPWFISQTDLIQAIFHEDDAVLVVFAREPS